MRRAGLRTCKQHFQVEFREKDRFQNERGLPTEIFWPDRPFDSYDEVVGLARLGWQTAKKSAPGHDMQTTSQASCWTTRTALVEILVCNADPKDAPGHESLWSFVQRL